MDLNGVRTGGVLITWEAAFKHVRIRAAHFHQKAKTSTYRVAGPSGTVVRQLTPRASHCSSSVCPEVLGHQVMPAFSGQRCDFGRLPRFARRTSRFSTGTPVPALLSFCAPSERACRWATCF